MNAKTSLSFIYVEVIIYLLLYNLDDCTFKAVGQIAYWKTPIGRPHPGKNNFICRMRATNQSHTTRRSSQFPLNCSTFSRL